MCESWAGSMATRSKHIIAVTKLVLKTPFSRDCLPDSVMLTRLGLFDSTWVPWKRKAKNDFPCDISVCSQLFIAGMNSRTFVHRIIELQLIATCDRRWGRRWVPGVIFLDVCVIVCSVGYICVIYAMKKMTLHQFMAARFPNFSALNDVHFKVDI